MKSTRKIIFTTVIAALISINSMAQWNTVIVPTKNHLTAIAIIGGTTGWIVGNNGTMLYLSGDSWAVYPSVTSEKLNSVCLLSETEGWAVGARGTILQLKGAQWQRVESPTQQELHTVCFSNTSIGYAVGNNGTLLSYKNGIWEMDGIKTPWHFYAIAINEDNMMVAGGRENITVPIMDVMRGDVYNFSKVYDPGYIEISAMASPGDNIAWAVGNHGTILNKNGATWQKEEIEGKLPGLTSVFFSGIDKGITVGHGGTIMTYSESGWKREKSPVDVKLNGSCIAGDKYYAVGNNGTVLVLTRNQKPDSEEEFISSRAVISSYPNPTSGTLNVIVPETINGGVITVFNSMGQVVLMRELGKGKGGTTDQISTSGLGNGLYVVNIFTNGRITASGKFIVQH